MENELKKKATSGLIWSMMEKLMTQGFSFVIGIIMARLLMPEDYGYIVIVTNIISFAEAIVEGGLSNAYIQKKDTDEEHSSTMFYFMLIIAGLFYILIMLLAPVIARIYAYEELTIILRVFSISLIVGAIRTFLVSEMKKSLRFRLQFVSSLTGTVVAGIIGVAMAVLGYGIWALVAYTLIDMIMDTVVMGIQLKWRPKRIFSKDKLKDLYKYAKYSLGWNLVNQYTNLFIELFIGKKYTSSDLSYYNRGKQYPYLMCNIINTAMDNTLFPVLSKISDKQDQLKNTTRRYIKVATYLQLPVLFGLAVTANSLVIVLLTDKWLPCVPFLQITCIAYSFWPYITCYRNAVESKGDIKYTFRNEVIMSLSKLVMCAIAIFISPFAVAVAYLLSWYLDYLLNSIVVKKQVDYSIKEQLLDVAPNYVCTLIMVVCAYLVGMPDYNVYIKIVAQVLTGVVAYLATSIVFKNESFKYIIDIIKRR